MNKDGFNLIDRYTKKNIFNNVSNNRGFTLVELIVVMVVLAIMLTLGGLAIISWQDYATFTQENEYAQTLFVAAQNQLAEYSANGRLETLQKELKNGDSYGGGNKGLVLLLNDQAKGIIDEDGVKYTESQIWIEAYKKSAAERDRYIDDIVAIRADAGQYSMYENDPENLKQTDPEAYWVYELLGAYVYDKSILNNAAISIEFTPDDGQVFAVLYSDKNNAFAYKTHEGVTTFSDGVADIEDRQEAYRNDHMIGYYGITTLTKATRDKANLAKAEIYNVILHNENTLNLTFDIKEGEINSLEYQIDLKTSDVVSNATYADKLRIVIPAGELKNTMSEVTCHVSRFDAGGNLVEGEGGTKDMDLLCMMRSNDTTGEPQVLVILDAADIHAGTNLYKDYLAEGELHSEIFADTYSIFRFGIDMAYARCDVTATGIGYMDSDEVESNVQHMCMQAAQITGDSAYQYSVANARHFYNIRYIEELNKKNGIGTVKYILTNNSETDDDGQNLIDWGYFVTNSSYNRLYDSNISYGWNIASLPSGCNSLSMAAFPSLYELRSGVTISTLNGVTYELKNFKFDGMANEFYDFSPNHQNSTNQDDVELTGLVRTNNGYIENIKMTNVKVNGVNYVGAFAGKNNGTLKNVNVTNVLGLTITGRDYVGGIVGQNNNLLDNVSVGDAVNVFVVGQNYVGGITGQNNNSMISSDNNLVNSYATVSGEDYIGGIVGDNASGATITNYILSSDGVEGNEYIGFICGINRGLVATTNNQVAVLTPNVTGTKYVGGITGENTLGARITDYTVSDGSVVGQDYVGGIAGKNESAISALAMAKITVKPSVKGSKYVGGVVGSNMAGATINNYEVNNGNVEGVDTSYYVGGFVGLNESIALLQDADNNAVELSSNPDSVTGDYFVGGFVGGNIINTKEYAGLYDTEIIQTVKQGDIKKYDEGRATSEKVYATLKGNYQMVDNGSEVYYQAYAVTISITNNLESYNVYDWQVLLNNTLDYRIETNGGQASDVDNVNKTVSRPLSDNNYYTAYANKTTETNVQINIFTSDEEVMKTILSSEYEVVFTDDTANQMGTNNLDCTVNITNGTPYYAGATDGTYNIYINNNSDYVCHFWELGIEVPEGVTISNVYPCVYQLKGNVLVLSSGSSNWNDVSISKNKPIELTVQIHGNSVAAFNFFQYAKWYLKFNGVVYNTNSESYIPTVEYDTSYVNIPYINMNLSAGTINSIVNGKCITGGYLGYNLLFDSSDKSADAIAEELIGVTVSKSYDAAYDAISQYDCSCNSATRLKINNDLKANNVLLSSDEGYVNSSVCAGGVIGYSYKDNYIDVYNWNNNKTVLATDGMAGGIAGYSGENCYINNCINSGEVQASVTGNAGGIAGANYGKIEACSNKANVAATSGLCGGISSINGMNAEILDCSVGKLDSSNETITLKSNIAIGGVAAINKGKIADTKVDACLYGKNGSSIYGYGGIAGLSGYNTKAEYLASDNTSAIIENCSFDGEINAIGSAGAWAKIGGIAGSNGYGASIKKSYIGVLGTLDNSGMETYITAGNLDTVKSASGTDNNSYAYVGGIAGQNYGTISDIDMESICVGSDTDATINMDSIKIISNAGATGGIVGWNYEGATIEGTSGGKITTSCRTTINMRRSENDRGVGGIIGVNQSGKKLSYIENYANVTGNYNANMKTGGIIGVNMQTESSQLGMSYCNNLGKVFGWANTGGFIGMDIYKGVDFAKCSNFGEVSAIDNSTSLYKYVGGFIGHVYAVSTSIDFTECKNHGKISTFGSNGRSAGFIARIEACANSNNITNCVNTGLIYASNSAKAANFISESREKWNLTLCRNYNTRSVSNWFVTGDNARYVYCFDAGFRVSEISLSSYTPFGGAYDSSGSYYNWYLTNNITIDINQAVNGMYPLRQDMWDHTKIHYVFDSSIGFKLKKHSPFTSTYKDDISTFEYKHSYDAGSIYTDINNGLLDVNSSINDSRIAVYRDIDESFCDAVLTKQDYNKLNTPTNVNAEMKEGEIILSWDRVTKDVTNKNVNPFGYEVIYSVVDQEGNVLDSGSTMQSYTTDARQTWEYPLTVENEWAEKKATVSFEVVAVSPHRYVNVANSTESQLKAKDSEPAKASVLIDKSPLPIPKVHIAMTPDNKMVAVLDNPEDYVISTTIKLNGVDTTVILGDVCTINVVWGTEEFTINPANGNVLSNEIKYVSGDDSRKLEAYSEQKSEYAEVFMNSKSSINMGSGLTNASLVNCDSYTETSFDGFIGDDIGSANYKVTYTGGDDAYLTADIGYYDDSIGAQVYTDRDVVHVASSGGAASSVISMLDVLPTDVMNGKVKSDIIVRSYLEASQNEIIHYGYTVATNITLNGVDKASNIALLKSITDDCYITVDAGGTPKYMPTSIWDDANNRLKPGYTLYAQGSNMYKVVYNASLAKAELTNWSYSKYAAKNVTVSAIETPDIAKVGKADIKDSDNYIVNFNLKYDDASAYSGLLNANTGLKVEIVAKVDVVEDLDNDGVLDYVATIYNEDAPLVITDYGNQSSVAESVVAAINSEEYKKIFEDYAGSELRIAIKAHAALAIDSSWTDTVEGYTDTQKYVYYDIPKLAIEDNTAISSTVTSGETTVSAGLTPTAYKVEYTNQAFIIEPDDNVSIYTIRLTGYDNTNHDYVIYKKVENGAIEWYLGDPDNGGTKIGDIDSSVPLTGFDNELTDDIIKGLITATEDVRLTSVNSLPDDFSVTISSRIYITDIVDLESGESNKAIVVDTCDLLSYEITIEGDDNFEVWDTVGAYSGDYSSIENIYYKVKQFEVISGYYDGGVFVSGLDTSQQKRRQLKLSSDVLWRREDNYDDGIGLLMYSEDWLEDGLMLLSDDEAILDEALPVDESNNGVIEEEAKEENEETEEPEESEESEIIEDAEKEDEIINPEGVIIDELPGGIEDDSDAVDNEETKEPEENGVDESGVKPVEESPLPDVEEANAGDDSNFGGALNDSASENEAHQKTPDNDSVSENKAANG